MATEVNKILLEIELDASGVVKNSDQVNAQLKKLGVNADIVNKKLKATKDASGAAGAAVAEFGRLISDAPFGIQAVTNNLSQLGSMFAVTAANAGGAKNAIKEMVDVVFKAGRVTMVGWLIVFQAVIAAIELFAQRSRKAKDEAQGLDSVLKVQGKTYEELSNIVNNANETDERRLSVLRALGQFNKEITEIVNDENLTVKERIELGNRLNQARIREREIQKAATDELIKRNKLYANLTVSEEELQKRIERRAKAAESLERGYVEVMQNGVLVQQQLSVEHRGNIQTILNGLDREINAIKEGIPLREAIISQLESLTGQQETINDITEEYNKLTKSREKDVQNAMKAEEERIKIQEDALRRLQDQTDKFIKDQEASEIAQLDRAYQREIEAAKEVGADTTNIEQYYANERLRVKTEFANKRAENERNTNYKIEDAQRSHNIKMAQLEAKLAGDRIKESYRTEKEILDAEIRILESRIKILEILAQTSDVAKKSLDEALIVLDDLVAKRELISREQVEKTAEKIGKIADTVKQAASSINDILSAQADREIAIEKNKTTKLNDQLKFRLANEQLSADERDRINQQISKNEAKLVQKQNEIARKQFQREKALKIVMALADTASSASKAYLSQFLPIPTPDSPIRGTAAAALATAFGLAQVAALSRLKYTEQGMPSPSLVSQGGGGGIASQSPSFNVIGTTGENQLAAAISGVQQQPVRAYVVSNEVTTAQSLDRNIVAEASL